MQLHLWATGVAVGPALAGADFAARPRGRGAQDIETQDGNGRDGRELPALIARARGGDREAFGAVYERLAPQVYGYLYHHTGGETHLAEDLTEEVFVKVLEKLDRYRDRGLPFGAWVFRIARNHLVDHVRRRPAQRTVPLDGRHDPAEPRAERALDLLPARIDLARALRRLSADQRAVLLLGFALGLSAAETARAMGKTEGAIKQLRTRGLRALRRHLDGPEAAPRAREAGGVRCGT